MNTLGNLLAIDTSARYIHVAFNDVAADATTHQATCHSETRFLGNRSTSEIPLLLETLQLPNQLDGIIYGRGPGSFTGVRIALALASALSLVREVPLTSISSFTAYAHDALLGAYVHPHTTSEQPARVLIAAGRSGFYYATIVKRGALISEQHASFYRTLDALYDQIQHTPARPATNWVACGPGWRTLSCHDPLWQGCAWCTLDYYPSAVAMIDIVRTDSSTQWHTLDTLPPLDYLQASVSCAS